MIFLIFFYGLHNCSFCEVVSSINCYGWKAIPVNYILFEHSIGELKMLINIVEQTQISSDIDIAHLCKYRIFSTMHHHNFTHGFLP